MAKIKSAVQYFQFKKKINVTTKRECFAKQKIVNNSQI